MLENLNPAYAKNPMWPHVKRLGEYQKADLIKKEEIDSTLAEMERVNQGFKAASLDTKIRPGMRAKLQQGYDQFQHTIEGVRRDLGDAAKYVLKDGFYVRVPGNRDGLG